MTIFINFEEEVEEEVELVDENQEKLKTLLGKSIDEIELSVRSYNTLKSLDISTIDQLVKKTEDELKKSKHYSDMVMKEIKDKLDVYHLSLGLKE
jgi:DNA-directed RNA polymerase subunit alpha